MIKIARIAVTLGLLSSLGAQAYAAGLVVNDNDLRNDLAWLCLLYTSIFMHASEMFKAET